MSNIIMNSIENNWIFYYILTYDPFNAAYV